MFSMTPRRLRVVAVSTKTGQTIRGMLVDEKRDGLVLRAAALANLDQNQVVKWDPLDGDVVVPMDNVDFWQDALDPKFLMVEPG
jgi:hypothetical protein